jgi:O-acetyl-ADP-ribose deacetylase (regulator of RNase III)
MEERARKLVLEAIDGGWSGPPFDPLALAEQIGLPTEARGDITDARIVPSSKSKLHLEYNPIRPRGRLRFSVAHEIAHTLFPDCAEAVRNRSVPAPGGDEWQLEVLCNIGAAEILMPLGSFAELVGEELSIENVLELRKQFDVSVEACIIRMVKLSRQPVGAFCASAHGEGRFKLDYVIPTAGWVPPVDVGAFIPAQSVVRDVSAIGYTAVANENWVAGAPMRVECVGLSPYPGQTTPRVVGLLRPRVPKKLDVPSLKELNGDALKPSRREGRRIVAHVVPNTPALWGGGGFASQVRQRFPDVFTAFQQDIARAGGAPKLGSTFIGELEPDTLIVHMVAQAGFGPSKGQRLRYAALAECLGNLRQFAHESSASVHMPRVGTGHGGASWDIVKELITTELVDRGIDTTVYQRPS